MKINNFEVYIHMNTLKLTLKNWQIHLILKLTPLSMKQYFSNIDVKFENLLIRIETVKDNFNIFNSHNA